MASIIDLFVGTGITSETANRKIYFSSSFDPLDIAVVEWKCEDKNNRLGNLLQKKLFCSEYDVDTVFNNWFRRFRELNVSLSTLSDISRLKTLPKAKQYRGVFNLYELNSQSPERDSRNILSYSGSVLDIEQGKGAECFTVEQVVNNVKKIGCRACIYSTLRHTSQSPRLRVVIPYDVNVSVEKWKLITRFLGVLIAPNGCFDSASVSVSQVMAMPVRCSDGEGVLEFTEGNLLNAEATYDFILNSAEVPSEVFALAKTERDVELEKDIHREENEKEIILSALGKIPPSELPYNEWIGVGIALKASGFDRSVWEQWSLSDDRHKGDDCSQKRWEGFKCDRMGSGFILKKAQSFGWIRPYPQVIIPSDSGKDKIDAYGLSEYFKVKYRLLFLREQKSQNLLSIYIYSDGVYRLKSRDQIIGLFKDIVCQKNPKLMKMNVLREAYDLLISDSGEGSDACKSVSPLDINNDENYINFKNGLFNLKTWSIEEHTPDILSTIQIPCNYTGKPSPVPVFTDYIRTLCDENKESMLILLEFLGACISNIRGSRFKKALFLDGVGNSGKSQYRELIYRLLGENNTASSSLSSLEERFGLSPLFGKRVAGDADMRFITIAELQNFKRLTGGDTVQVEFKGKTAFDYKFNGLLLFCTNGLPKFGGDDGEHVYERFIPIRCPNVIPVEKRDSGLIDKMMDEREGIVFIAIEALRTAIENGYKFSEGETISLNREKYVHENSSIRTFFSECMTARADGKINDTATTSKIFDAYCSWCSYSANCKHKSEIEFRKGVQELLRANEYQDLIVSRNNGSYYKDWTLTAEAKRKFHVLDTVENI